MLRALRVGPQPNDRQAFVYAYDASGNRVNLNWPGPPGPNTQGMDYVYDREGRLIVAQAYQTNYQGYRIDREVTRLFYDGLGRRLVKEYDPKTGAGGVKRTEYVLDNLDPVAEYFLWNGQREEYYRGSVETFSPTPMLLALRHFPAGTEGQTYWYHLDGRGSVAGLTKHQGQSTHNYRYDAYGQLLPAQGDWTDPHNHYTFAGKEWDEALGLYEFGVRLYDPWAGVWLTREPLPAQTWEPRTWHRYQYAFANPISYYDPYGGTVIAGNAINSVVLAPAPPVPIPVPLAPKPVGAQAIDQCTPQPWAIQIIIDTHQIVQRIPFSSRTWAQVTTTLDLFAWTTDVFASGFVAAGTVLGFVGGVVVEEKPIPGGTIAAALAALWMTEVNVQPLIRVGNLLATGASFATLISEAKTGETRLQASLILSPEEFSLNYQAKIGPSSQVAVVTTTAGWLVWEAFSSLTLQSIALASDLDWLTVPWGTISSEGRVYVPLQP